MNTNLRRILISPQEGHNELDSLFLVATNLLSSAGDMSTNKSSSIFYRLVKKGNLAWIIKMDL